MLAYMMIKSSLNRYLESFVMLFLGYTGTTQLALYIRAFLIKAGLEGLDNPTPILRNIQFRFFRFRLTLLSLVSLLIAGWITWKYIYSSYWVYNNLLAISFSIYFLNQLIVTTFANSVVYLAGMFMYDVFWVYGSDVMVTVAKELNLPIKLQFPFHTGGIILNFYVLGIGDIILPGIFVALMLRFDFLKEVTSHKLTVKNFVKVKTEMIFAMPYFTAAILGYFAGLMGSILVFRLFDMA
jgi:minor histocompatibility antigen H13